MASEDDSTAWESATKQYNFKCPARKKTKLVTAVNMAYIYKFSICNILFQGIKTTQKQIYINQKIEELKAASGWGVGFDKLNRLRSSANKQNSIKDYKGVKKESSFLVTVPDMLQEEISQEGF